MLIFGNNVRKSFIYTVNYHMFQIFDQKIITSL